MSTGVKINVKSTKVEELPASVQSIRQNVAEIRAIVTNGLNTLDEKLALARLQAAKNNSQGVAEHIDGDRSNNASLNLRCTPK